MPSPESPQKRMTAEVSSSSGFCCGRGGGFAAVASGCIKSRLQTAFLPLPRKHPPGGAGAAERQESPWRRRGTLVPGGDFTSFSYLYGFYAVKRQPSIRNA